MSKKIIKASVKPTTENLDLLNQSYDLRFKLVVIGDSGSGKTSLLRRYTDDFYTDQDGDLTGGDEYRVKVQNVLDKKIKNIIWDTKGTRDKNYSGADAFIITLDLTDKNSLDNAKLWIKHLEEFNAELKPIILIGTKCDMEHAISDEAIEDFTNGEKSILGYVETSAKENININSAFEILPEAIIEQKTRSLNKEIDMVNKLKTLCENYRSHLEKNILKESATKKMEIIDELYEILKTTQMPNIKMEKFNTHFNKHKKELEAHQDSAGIRFLTSVLHVISLGIYSKLTKGTFAFWKSHGAVLCNDIEQEQKQATRAKI